MFFRLTKKLHRLVTLAIVLLGLPFIMMPVFHYHPGHTHSHGNDLGAHHHSGYFHSPAMERLAQAVRLDTGELGLDDHHTHSHSDSDSETEEDGFFTQTAHLPGKFTLHSKAESPLFSLPHTWETPGNTWVSETFITQTTLYFRIHSQRSPPLIL